jgi:endonuclease/exonuclease/phosphatase family metal-dependent hydrolase
VTENSSSLPPRKKRPWPALRPRQEAGASGEKLRVVTYNVHKCRGLDGRVRPGRIVEILQEVDADIIALQEVLSIEGREREDNQARFFAEELGFDYRIGETRRLRGGIYGNLVLSRLPLLFAESYDISHWGREERGCLRVDISLASTILHVYNVHLGTAYLERRHQGRKLLAAEILNKEDIRGPRILLGDFNEWLRGLTSRLLVEHFGDVDVRAHLKRKRTYPGLFPFLHLDHIYFDPSLVLEDALLYRTRLSLTASDHLPLVADFRVKV